MSYSTKAAALRRCHALRKDGQPCQAWALWGGTLCSAHTYKRRRTWPRDYRRWPTKARCTCAAYPFPHRPAAGLCRWPDPPTRTWGKPAGTHSWMKPGRLKAYVRAGGSDFATDNVHAWARVMDILRKP